MFIYFVFTNQTSSGRAWTTRDCPSGTKCNDGRCVTAGTGDGHCDVDVAPYECFDNTHYKLCDVV